MPSDERDKDKDRSETMKSATTNKPARFSQSRSEAFSDSTSTSAKQTKSHKHLFSVKPGGIAGYLGIIVLISYAISINMRAHAASLTGTASYVDIRAKTDAYVGFLPSHALERLLEKRPIVLLTLAKRLISLLSPLGLQFPTI